MDEPWLPTPCCQTARRCTACTRLWLYPAPLLRLMRTNGSASPIRYPRLIVHLYTSAAKSGASRFYRPRSSRSLQDGKWDRVAQKARSSWTPGAEHTRSYAFNRVQAGLGVPLTLAACGAAICCGFVMFACKWQQHGTMYPLRPRSLPGPKAAPVKELETRESGGGRL